MTIFSKTEEEQKKIAALHSDIQNTLNAMAPYKEQADLTPLKKLSEQFKRQTEELYQTDRKLNIGVVGQVKAGKSTFLNTLLFDGASVLPSARTPKTAVLTKIEYAPENSLTVEYYNRTEWAILEKLAQSKIDDNEHTAAREILALANKNKMDVYSYIDRQRETFGFGSAQELMNQLDAYVGAEGKITPVVKTVTIYTDLPMLSEISVVDTPGLNDAIASRTDKTREFLEKCDVVFFLSRTSQFLDAVDIKLVTSQLPQEGTANLLVIGSQLDSGLLDVLKKIHSPAEAAVQVRSQLTQHAREIVSKLEQTGLHRDMFLKACRDPVFISSMAYTASMKQPKDYSKSEAFILKRLQKYEDISAQELRRIGNMDTIKDRFDTVIRRKDEMLQQRASELLPRMRSSYQSVIEEILTQTRQAMLRLQNNDKESIDRQKRMIESRISSLRTALEEVFGELLIRTEECKLDCLKKLRSYAQENSGIEERQGTEWHEETHTTYRHHFLFFRWGKEVSTERYPTNYSYLAASDALENIRSFAQSSCTAIENAFAAALDIRQTKKKLLRVILDQFDTDDETFDINGFRHIVEMTLNRIEFPVFTIDVSDHINSIANSFSGEVRKPEEISRLKYTISGSIDRLFREVCDRLLNETIQFKNKLGNIQNGFEDNLLKTAREDHQKITLQLANKEQELKNYAATIELLKQIKTR